MVEMLIVKSKIKSITKECNVASDFAEKLNLEVISLIKKAEGRAIANKRKTLQAKDL